MIDAEKIRNFAVDFWLKSGKIEWPTIRHTARKLRMRIDDVYDIVSSDSDMCDEYWHAKHKTGDRFICVINDDRLGD